MLTATIILLAAAMTVIVFFGAVVAPAIFRTLPPDAAGRLIRVLFPRYYFALGVLTALAAITAALSYPLAALLVALAAAGFVWARQVLRPKINLLRDLANAGDITAKAEFDRLHKLSVRLNGAQLVLLLAALTLIVWA